MQHRPSLFRIINTDYIALVAVVFPAVFWVFYLGLLIFQARGAEKFMIYPILATPIGLLLLIWRIWMISTIFEHGLSIPATVSNLFFDRDRGQICYIYMHEGRKFEGVNFVHKNKRAAALKVGDKVTAVIDRNNPKRAFIQELYL